MIVYERIRFEEPNMVLGKEDIPYASYEPKVLNGTKEQGKA
jgi:hypothetical protein